MLKIYAEHIIAKLLLAPAFNAGGFAHLTPGAGEQGSPKPKREVKPAPKKADTSRKDKRRAASPAKAAAAKADAPDFSPLSMSDEEYMKQFDPRLM